MTREDIDKDLAQTQDQVTALQAAVKVSPEAKYRQYKPGELNEYTEVHEYVRPDGDKGYVTYYRAVDGKDTYIKKFNVGREQIEDIREWTLLVDDGGI